jgi:CRISPR/Cas system CMR-associated protein Cmr1 (group 7 of RAMP superfamily)
MISDICFQQIQDNFWYGQYGEFKVVMMKDNGWVNATKLCSDGGREFKHWKENASSKALISTLEKHLRVEASDSSMAPNAEADLTCGD